MTEVKTTNGKVLFRYDETTTTLKEEIRMYKNLEDADLRGENLENADLRWANLRNADLSDAKLKCANLKDANFRWANLSGANLEGAYLGGADLSHADLKRTKLNFAYLGGANLSGVDIRGANLSYADLGTAKNIPDNLPMACPSEGAFIAWKKVDDDFLVKLEIPADAKRSSATTKKCRCSKALVLDIECMWSGEHTKMVVNDNYRTCVYEVGKMVYPDKFDENRWNECSHGIHFFVDRDDAVNYFH